MICEIAFSDLNCKLIVVGWYVVSPFKKCFFKSIEEYLIMKKLLPLISSIGLCSAKLADSLLSPTFLVRDNRNEKLIAICQYHDLWLVNWCQSFFSHVRNVNYLVISFPQPVTVSVYKLHLKSSYEKHFHFLLSELKPMAREKRVFGQGLGMLNLLGLKFCC